ncbi:MAG: hypothetical protein JW860_09590 [Sedimentisphaerales bacterium]|nr:hypothetical protein [Sedimentisphaerales bacterium]
MDNLVSDSDNRLERAWEFEKILMRLDLLEPDDRVMVELFLRYEVPITKLSKMLGDDKVKIHRRIRRIIQRLQAPEYIRILRKKDFFARVQLDVAYDHFLLGMGYRPISIKRGISYTQARYIVSNLRQWLKGRKTISEI